MKRRNFLSAVGASFAALSLLTPSEAWAAKKTTRGKTAKSTTAKKRTTKKTGKTPAAATTTAPAATADNTRTPLSTNAFDTPPPPAEPWRSYEIVTSITRLDTNGPARVWLPLALEHDTPWQRLRDHRWRGNFDHAGLARNAADNMEIFTATWDRTPDPREAGAGMPILEIVSRVDVRERHFDLTRRHRAEERPEVLRHDVQPLPLLVDATRLRQSAEHIIGRIKDPLARGKAIYDWVLEQSLSPRAAAENAGIAALFAQPRAIAAAAGNHGTTNSVAGEGVIDEGTAMTLAFVGLCRAAGLPARTLFGLCIDASRLSPGLGCSGGTNEEGRLHAVPRCRAEFFAPGYGWIPVAPGEVKQALSSDGATLGEAKSNALKKLLFGFWEMNWIAFNAATGVPLPESGGGMLPFFTAPLARALTRTGGDVQGDWLRQPGAFAYRIDARRIDSDAAAPQERNTVKVQNGVPGNVPDNAGAPVPSDPQDEDDEAAPEERGGGQ